MAKGKRKHFVENQKAYSKKGGGYSADHGEDFAEDDHANPNAVPESAGFYYVDDTTKDIQARVHLMLKRAKQVLTVQQYNAFFLVDIKHLTLREVGKVMEVNHARVDHLVKRARLKLQKVYEGTENEI